MKPLDRFLQRWRIAKATRFVRSGDRLLDVGCFDRTLLDRVSDRIAAGTGVDPEAIPYDDGRLRVLAESFPKPGLFETGSFDCITLLAVLEHVDDPSGLAAECHRLLAPGGRLVVTVPHPFVDRILDVLIRLRILDGMEAEAHHGFDVARTGPIFREQGFTLMHRAAFQLGLNHLFVWQRGAG